MRGESCKGSRSPRATAYERRGRKAIDLRAVAHGLKGHRHGKRRSRLIEEPSPMKRISLVLASISILAGCATAQVRSTPESHPNVSGEACARALTEAFAAYEQEVE